MTNSRKKGSRGELELSNLLKSLGFKTRRGQQYSGASGDADVVGLDGIHIECKRVEALQIYKAVEQAKSDAPDDTTPVVMFRKNRQEWLVIEPLDTWIDRYKEANR